MKLNNKKIKGFTLVELLIVMGIISILAVVIIVQINPEQQMKDARNKQRKAHVSSIYLSFQEYRAKNNREYPSCLDEGSTYVDDCTNLVPDYFSSLPEDPSGQSECYFIEEKTHGITVTAECAESGEEIKEGQ